MAVRTQSDIVREATAGDQGAVTENLRLPGVETLHTREKAEIAEVLTSVLKSRAGLTQLVWNVGKSIEVTYERV